MIEKTRREVGFASDAIKNPQRVVFITKKTSAKVKGEVGPQLIAYPHLILREAITLQVVVIALVVVALLWDARLEQLANPFSPGILPRAVVFPRFAGAAALFPAIGRGNHYSHAGGSRPDRYSLFQRQRTGRADVGRKPRAPLASSAVNYWCGCGCYGVI